MSYKDLPDFSLVFLEKTESSRWYKAVGYLRFIRDLSLAPPLCGTIVFGALSTYFALASDLSSVGAKITIVLYSITTLVYLVLLVKGTLLQDGFRWQDYRTFLVLSKHGLVSRQERDEFFSGFGRDVYVKKHLRRLALGRLTNEFSHQNLSPLDDVDVMLDVSFSVEDKLMWLNQIYEGFNEYGYRIDYAPLGVTG